MKLFKTLFASSPQPEFNVNQFNPHWFECDVEEDLTKNTHKEAPDSKVVRFLRERFTSLKTSLKNCITK